VNSLLSARGLGCVRDGNTVLTGVDLDLYPGQLVGLIGPNGSGKSTLLGCLNATRAATGTVTLGDRPLAGLAPRQVAQRLALMHQNTAVAFPFTAQAVVALGRHPHQSRWAGEGADDRRAVESAMVATDTVLLAGQSVTQLSGGELQRVLFAQALAQAPSVLLLDEPTASLDLSYQESIFGAVRDWVGQDRSALVAIHDLRLAARHCDKLLLLSQGRILATGTPTEVLTADHLSAAYGVEVRVYENPITGLVDYQFRPSGDESKLHIHVIGGGGSAADVLRLLGEGRYRVTAGVLAPGDTDLQVASVYGMPVITCPPFSAIPLAAFEANRDLADRADLTIVTNLAFGALNQSNLESALGARKLVLIEDDPPEGRDFTGGPGLALYRRLANRATVLKGAELKGWLADQ